MFSSITIKKISLIIFLALILSVSLSAEEARVTLHGVSGEVTVLASGGSSWQKAEEGMSLTSGSSVKTAKGSSVILSLNIQNSNIVSLRSNSHVVLMLKDNNDLTLIDGELFSSIQRLGEGSSFAVQTPLAVCAVRGTKYTVKYDSKSLLTTLSVLENSVVLESLKEPGKYVPVKELEERALCPWESTLLKVKGVGFGKALEKAKNSSKEITEEVYVTLYGAENLISAKRAGAVDAHRNLVAKIYGTVISSSATLGDYADKSDAVRVKINGIVRGAKETSAKYYSEGKVIVTYEVKGTEIKETLTPTLGDIFGTTCLSGPTKLTFADFSKFEEALR